MSGKQLLSCKSLLTTQGIKKLLLYYNCFVRNLTTSGLAFARQNANFQRLEGVTRHTHPIVYAPGYVSAGNKHSLFKVS